jgi:hypothetical protein
MGDDGVVQGSWSGHYVQFGREWPIAAELWQEGTRLDGAMTDGVTDHDIPYSVALPASADPPESEARLADLLRRINPDLPDGPLRHVSRLPTDSDLSGVVRGRVVRFRKVYQGKSLFGVRVGDWKWVRLVAGHTVQYRGVLSEDGTRIEGLWWIRPRGLQALWSGPKAEGAFQLRRL